MSRQDAATRLRNDPRAAAAVAIWGVTIVAVLIATGWHLLWGESAPVSLFGLCAGATVAAALNLFADLTFHQSGMGRGSDGHGSLAAFIATVFPPFVPAAVLMPDGSYLATSYLIILFAAVSLLAWTVGERRGYMRFQKLFQRERAAEPVKEPVAVVPKPIERPALPQAQPVSIPIPQPTLPQKPPIVLLPQPRAIHNAPPIAVPDRPPRMPVANAPARPAEKETPAKPVRMFKSHAEHAQHPEPRISQWLKRTTDDSGSERIEGTIRVNFEAGQRQATVHIPFIPALATMPRIDCHPLDGSHVRLKVGLAQKFGTRIEARRSDSGAEPLVVEIGFTAIPADGQSDAA